MKKYLLAIMILVLILCSACGGGSNNLNCDCGNDCDCNSNSRNDSNDSSSTQSDSSKNNMLTVPKFVGLVYDEMIEDSRYSDFNITVQYEFDGEVPAGQIISQSLKEGRTIKKTEEITIIVSKGPETVKIPKVDGLNIQDAKMQLTRAGLKYNEIPQPSESVTKDCVIMTNPAANSVIYLGETIDVYVSTGPDVVWSTVGEYINLTEEVAKQLIEKDGFKVGQVIYKDSAADKGYVIEQSYAANTQLEKGSAIDIVVSMG